MPTAPTARLTDRKIDAAKPQERAYKLRDTDGLYLDIRPSGSKLWRYRYSIAGKENLFALGKYPVVGLKAARDARDEAEKLVRAGIHPAHHRQQQANAESIADANTFKAIAEDWIAQEKSHWTPYYLRQVERFMGSDVFPFVGAMPIRKINAQHLREVVQRIAKGRIITIKAKNGTTREKESAAPRVALNVRMWCGQIFRHAVANGLADGDPSAALKGLVKAPKVKHHAPLTRDGIVQLFKALGEYKGYPATMIAIRLMLLTFVRTVELRNSQWSEFNFDDATWRIPAERMKMRELHIVPLSPQAVALLKELHTLTGNQPFLFPNVRDPKRVMTATTLNRALERMGMKGFSAHGFRATAATMLYEAGFIEDDVERQLAHAERNAIRASYDHHKRINERRVMLNTWADMTDAMLRPVLRIAA